MCAKLHPHLQSLSTPQVALSHAAGWVSAFAHLNEHSCVTGLGQAKNTEECLNEVSYEEMSEVNLFSPALATYLHDDPSYLRNKELDI